MTVEEVFDNWAAYIRLIDREDFRAQLTTLATFVDSFLT